MERRLILLWDLSWITWECEDHSKCATLNCFVNSFLTFFAVSLQDRIEWKTEGNEDYHLTNWNAMMKQR